MMLKRTAERDKAYQPARKYLRIRLARLGG
jgi:hypothetical protein